MQKSILTLAVIAALTSNAAMAASNNVQGSSSGSLVQVGPSTHTWFDKGNSGLKLNNSSSGYIDLADGPIRGSNAALADAPDSNGNYFLYPAHVGQLPLPLKVAQVWKDETSVNDANTGSDYANFAVNSVRQITTLSLAPQFGGLVIGQVGETTPGAVSSTTLLPVGEGVYFGEWAPRVGSPAASGTNLNMTSGDRTVWYVGDNATTSTTMPTTINATYGVIGTGQTGTDANGNTLAGGLPGNLNLYQGKLDVAYANGSGTIGAGATNNSISRDVNGVTQTISFAGTTIGNSGSFSNGSTIQGQFYNGAEALAGIYQSATGVADDVAFGGSKISGTITP
ncbi:hypothetical protein [Thiopseudomonas denitrificans]|uniref:Transferrin-binding protein B C-lobe/N-lobe beta barrel domain-containing protein n=1 Tax=Thiopseudomonas denitrificans TaxID=1501432 RepID=A0A4R6TWV7_9GAMM|nr:hypothetical protein [Thiopseudomonas denitrificans]TDQ36489.1 hypothetical protein DFQ45_11236 [Thiopseudomonas denitrificans]